MAVTEPPFARSQLETHGAHSVHRTPSTASTWYLVIGAAVLLTILYMLTTGLMRPVADPVRPEVSAVPGQTQPLALPEVTIQPAPAR